jgi:prepilin-type processing-associated H-X9-DG protein
MKKWRTDGIAGACCLMLLASVACADSARIQEKAQGTKVTLSLKETPVGKALDTISAMGGITVRKIDVRQRPRNVVTAELKDVTVLDAVTTVAKMAGLTFEVVDDGIEVSGQLDNVRRAAIACKMFADDHGGVLPSKVAELWPYLQSGDEVDESLVSLVAGGKMSDIKSPDTSALLRSKGVTSTGKRAVAFADGHCELVSDR